MTGRDMGMEGLMLIGEKAVGDDVNAAHVNVVLGDRSGPVGVAWATALATPSDGHVPFVAVLQPSVAVKPFTLFVTKSRAETPRHQELTWGAAQAGVASGVADAVAAGVISAERCESDVIIAAVWVNPDANDEDAVFENNREATRDALRNALDELPRSEEAAGARHATYNGYFRYPKP